MRYAKLAILLTLSVATLELHSGPTLAGAEEDAARIERKFEIRKLARDIYERADNRAKEAAKQSPTIQKNNAEMMKLLDECMKISNQALDEFKKTPPSLLKNKLLKQSEWALSQEPDGCMGRAFAANPNSEIIDELRDDFIDEELESLRNSLDEPKRKELESEIRELSA